MVAPDICTNFATSLDSLNHRLRRPKDDDFVNVRTEGERFKSSSRKYVFCILNRLTSLRFRHGWILRIRSEGPE